MGKQVFKITHIAKDLGIRTSELRDSVHQMTDEEFDHNAPLWTSDFTDFVSLYASFKGVNTVTVSIMEGAVEKFNYLYDTEVIESQLETITDIFNGAFMRNLDLNGHEVEIATSAGMERLDSDLKVIDDLWYEKWKHQVRINMSLKNAQKKTDYNQTALRDVFKEKYENNTSTLDDLLANYDKINNVGANRQNRSHIKITHSKAKDMREVVNGFYIKYVEQMQDVEVAKARYDVGVAKICDKYGVSGLRVLRALRKKTEKYYNDVKELRELLDVPTIGHNGGPR